MYASEGRLGQSGDGEASVNVYIYKCLVIILFCKFNFIAQFSEYSHVNVQLFIYDKAHRSILLMVGNLNVVIFNSRAAYIKIS
jgi:hypothetical protein